MTLIERSLLPDAEEMSNNTLSSFFNGLWTEQEGLTLKQWRLQGHVIYRHDRPLMASTPMTMSNLNGHYLMAHSRIAAGLPAIHASDVSSDYE